MPSNKDLLVEHMASLDREQVLALADDLVKNGISSSELLELLRLGLDSVENSYAAGEYFIADLIMADAIFQEVVQNAMGEEISRPVVGSVVIGTVQGDIHELGKTLVELILQYNGFRVEDLGADVSPKRFVSALMTYAPNILILSGTISGSEIMMARTIEAIEEAGLRRCVKIILGGNCIGEKQAFAIGADGYSEEAAECLRLCRQFISREG